MSETTEHGVDEVLPPQRLAALGIQHVLVMYAGAVAVPFIISVMKGPGASAFTRTFMPTHSWAITFVMFVSAALPHVYVPTPGPPA